jgi:hypothetical protein
LAFFQQFLPSVDINKKPGKSMNNKSIEFMLPVWQLSLKTLFYLNLMLICFGNGNKFGNVYIS